MSTRAEENVSIPTIVIRPSNGWIALKLADVWEYRELLYFLVWRDIKVRYKQTALGAAWAIIQPFFTMVVFSLFFGRLAKMPSDGVPYPLFAFAALVPWTFFASGLAQSANSLVGSAEPDQQGLLSPPDDSDRQRRWRVSWTSAIAFVVLLGMMVCYGIMPTARILWLPAVSAARARDGAGRRALAVGPERRVSRRRYTVPFMTQFWMFATPIAYPSSLLPEPWRTGLRPESDGRRGRRVSGGRCWARRPRPGPMIAVSALRGPAAPGRRGRSTSAGWRRRSPTWSDADRRDPRRGPRQAVPHRRRRARYRTLRERCSEPRRAAVRRCAC